MRIKKSIFPYIRGSQFFWFVLAATIFLGALYIFFVSSSVLHVVLREELELSVRAAQGRVAKLESEYFKKKQEVDLELVESLGFVAVSGRTFIPREALSIRTDD